jgi:hypothetical protein
VDGDAFGCEGLALRCEAIARTLITQFDRITVLNKQTSGSNAGLSEADNVSVGHGKSCRIGC